MKKINFILLTGLLCLAVSLPSCKKNKDDDNGVQNVKVGALLSLTGNWSSLGMTSQAAIAIALNDINKYQLEIGSRYRFQSVIYDTKLDPNKALTYIEQAKQSGCTFILGPQSSAEAGLVTPFAHDNNMIVMSQGSTAGSLSIAGDNLFRFCPDDHIEGSAIAHTIYKDGIKGLVTIARDDAGNKGLQASVGNAFPALGGTINALAPYSTTTTDFTAVVGQIKAKIQSLSALNGASATAVYLASFDECIGLFHAAASDPVLSSVKWYGGDGVVLSAALVGDTAAAAFAEATHFFAPTFGLPEHAQSKWMPLADSIKMETGIDPDAFGLAAYDALWVMALTYDATEGITPDFNKLKSMFKHQADSYYGVTGPTLLNDAGDRAIGSFDYWGIMKQAGVYKWVLVGKSE